MSWAIEEMLNIVWCLAADVEANFLTDSALVGAKESTMSYISLARVVHSFRVNSFSEKKNKNLTAHQRIFWTVISRGIIGFPWDSIPRSLDNLTLHFFLD